LYSENRSPDAIQQIQLDRFNKQWESISRTSPYYANARRSLGLPDQFATWADFSRDMPKMTRGDLKANVSRIALAKARPDYWRMTGGSSAEPIQLPAWRSEDVITAINTWFARSWFDVDSADRLFLLWGHSHLLGHGLHGWVNAAKRQLKDRCLGYFRSSAYDLSDEALREAGETILRVRPRYVLGYASALHRLASFNSSIRDRLRRLRLKVVIATGESFPSPESAELISDIFGCPVAMEYGAVETGTIAHQAKSGRYQVFWGTYYVEGLPSTEHPGATELAITALYPRLTPLIRYRIGDLAINNSDDVSINRGFDRVFGRCNDGIALGKSGFVHSESFSHVLRDVPEIDAFQVVQSESQAITVTYLAKSDLPEHTIRMLRDRLRRVDPRLQDASFSKVPHLSSTVAGKSKRIVSRAQRLPTN